MGTEKFVSFECGSNGYCICAECDEEIVWGQPCIHHSDQTYHPKCWDNYCFWFYPPEWIQHTRECCAVKIVRKEKVSE